MISVTEIIKTDQNNGGEPLSNSPIHLHKFIQSTSAELTRIKSHPRKSDSQESSNLKREKFHRQCESRINVINREEFPLRIVAIARQVPSLSSVAKVDENGVDYLPKRSVFYCVCLICCWKFPHSNDGRVWEEG